jgi:hypothetical protein
MLARWSVIPTRTPLVRRHCPGCGDGRWFRSSDAFRINAKQRRVDVWLIYKCDACDGTWNHSLYDRVLPSELGASLYEAFQQNDRVTAWRFAFDLPRLARTADAIDADCPVEIVRDGAPDALVDAIVLELAHPCRVRLDKLLARELGCSRQALARAARAGDLVVDPGGARALRRPARDQQIIRWRRS